MLSQVLLDLGGSCKLNVIGLVYTIRVGVLRVSRKDCREPPGSPEFTPGLLDSATLSCRKNKIESYLLITLATFQVLHSYLLATLLARASKNISIITERSMRQCS